MLLRMNPQINPLLKSLLSEEKTKLEGLNSEDDRYFRFGLTILGYFVRDDFFDIPLVDDLKDSGYCFTIPYLQDPIKTSAYLTYPLIDVYLVDGSKMFCPLMFYFHAKDFKEFEVIMKNDYGQWVFVGCRDFKFYTEVKESLTLSGYLNYK